MPRLVLQQDENLLHRVLVINRKTGTGRTQLAEGMGDVVDEFAWHISHRKHIVDKSSGYSAARHAVKFNCFWRLGHHHARFPFDEPYPLGAVAASPRQDDANGSFLLLLRQ